MPDTHPDDLDTSTDDTDDGYRDAVLLTLTAPADLPDGPNLPARMAAALGGPPQPGVDVDLGVQFWITAPPGALNRGATGLLTGLVNDITARWVGIDPAQHRRLATLRANGWEPELRGPCVVTGSVDADGLPTPLPAWFHTWAESHLLRSMEHHRVLFKSAGMYAITDNGLAYYHPRPQLRYGYNAGVPENVEDAWGCQAVIGDDHTTIELPANQISMAGPDAEHLVETLNATISQTQLRERLGALLRDGTLSCDADADVTVHRDANLVIKANTLGTPGRVYLCAYFPGPPPLRPSRTTALDASP